MGKSRRKHSREFKVEAVKQVVESGRPVTEVARGLGGNPGLLSRWKADYEASPTTSFPGNGNVNSYEQQIRHLRREPSIAQQERDILREAALLLAKV